MQKEEIRDQLDLAGFSFLLFYKQKKSFAEAKDRFLAGAEGLEPPTPGFGDRCSTN